MVAAASDATASDESRRSAANTVESLHFDCLTAGSEMRYAGDSIATLTLDLESTPSVAATATQSASLTGFAADAPLRPLD